MELSEFIKETLCQIAKGVHESQEEVRQCGGYVNPSPLHSKKSERCTSTPVNFDIALNVTEELGGKVGAHIEVATIFKADANKGKNTVSSKTHNISFTVDVMLPIDRDSQSIVDREKAELRNLGGIIH